MCAVLNEEVLCMTVVRVRLAWYIEGGGGHILVFVRSDQLSNARIRSK